MIPPEGNVCDSGVATTEIGIGDARVHVEVVHTPNELMRGLMGRESIPEDHGMLFIFPEPQRLEFWMKDTAIKLSIGFFDSNGMLLETRDMEPMSEDIVPSKSDEILYALEVNQGWFKWNCVKVGDVLQLKPSELPCKS